MPLLPLVLAASIPLTPLPHARVGEVQGTRAFVAISVDHGRLRAYVCDGTLKRDAKLATWFKGRWDGHSPLTLTADGHTLRIEGATTGSLDGRRFVLARTKMPAGLFDGRRGRRRATWIVQPDGRIRGAMVPTRPRKCRPVLTTTSNGSQQYVTVCG